jgi:hypothetical protein
LTSGSHVYLITIRGVASDLVRTEFEDVQVSVEGNTTCLRTAVADQAVLFGLIRRVESLGLVLLGVDVVQAEGQAADA